MYQFITSELYHQNRLYEWVCTYVLTLYGILHKVLIRRLPRIIKQLTESEVSPFHLQPDRRADMQIMHWSAIIVVDGRWRGKVFLHGLPPSLSLTIFSCDISIHPKNHNDYLSVYKILIESIICSPRFYNVVLDIDCS